MMTIPKEEEGKYTKRGEVYAQVVKNMGAKDTGVVNFAAGYTFKENSEVNIKIDDKHSFILFTNNIVNKSVEGLWIVKTFILLLKVSVEILGNLNVFFNTEGFGKLCILIIVLFCSVNAGAGFVISILKH